MKILKLIAIASIATFGVYEASAQTVGIGTTKRGATSQVSASIAKIASTHGGMQMRTQPMAGTQQYIPPVNAGSLEFGVANIMQTTWAYNGKVLSEGHPSKNLRMVATLMPFRVGPLVGAKSSIKSVGDIKGKMVPDQFKAAPLFKQIMIAIMANSNVSYADVKGVPVSGLRQHWDQLTARKVDVAIGAVGTGYLKLMAKKLDGVRFISMDKSPAAVARMQKYMPNSWIGTVQPSKALTGIVGPTNLAFFDYMLFAGKDVSDDVVYRVTKAMAEHVDELRATSPLWKGFTAKNMAKDQHMPFHPGAVKYYKEAGTWQK